MGETTNDEKLLKTSVSLERQTPEQITDEYKEYHKHLSTRFGIVFYDDKNVIPQALRGTVITLIHKGHPAINKLSAAAKPFWWPKLTKEIQAKCDDCIPCKVAGKNIKPQIPMSGINYLPPAENRNFSRTVFSLFLNGPLSALLLVTGIELHLSCSYPLSLFSSNPLVI